jgi:hypothetical protein
MPYLEHLKVNILVIHPNSWVVDQIKEKYSVFDHYPHREEDALNIGI